MDLPKKVQRDYIFTTLLSGFLGMLIFKFGSGWIRNYGGDIVVIIFLYSLISVVIPALTKKQKTSGVLFVAIAIEILQSLNLFHPGLTRDLVLGATFDPADIVIYILTAIACYRYDQKEGA